MSTVTVGQKVTYQGKEATIVGYGRDGGVDLQVASDGPRPEYVRGISTSDLKDPETKKAIEATKKVSEARGAVNAPATSPEAKAAAPKADAPGSLSGQRA